MGKFTEIYYRYAGNRALGLEYTEHYEALITYYNENYDAFANEAVFVTQYISHIIRNENLSPEIVEHRCSIYKTIKETQDGIFFRYESFFYPTYDSILGTIEIIHTLEQEM